MPVPVDDLTNNDPFPVKPDTNEYEVLSFLVAHHKYGFTPSEIAARTDLSEASASKAMARLFEDGLVERAETIYYIDPHRANELKQRLVSLDSAVQRFEKAPDDAYAKQGWEQEVPSIDRGERTESTSEHSKTAEERVEALIADIEDRRAEK
ncbi:helix-turn-helix domain-containing protein [Halobacterium salinarum]|uniref:MarR family transcriptional regulator n=1 Tax=Halobacterium salinarum TaxID=2242 RepID=UPI002557691B|nr:helix-turn-helix domain-containing protein [Halobacterium salinarum]MDL0139425.1 helix-turn-helix domain-containing protein [Halobacterium salinarum]